ncbi:hypothetical protein JL722_7197 [Aureococcus anophagefferens]|nr:hypothetical protein JL722_7197 [Aureococcus anophagefferens]
MALAATGVSMAPAESTAAASARTVSFGGLPPPPDDGVRERHSWRLGPKGSASVSMPALHSVGSSNADTLLSSSTTGSIRRRSKRDDDDGGAAGEPERRTIFFQRIPSEHGLDTGARVKRILLDLQHQRTGAPDEEQQRSPSSTLLYAQDLLVAALDAPRLATWIMASSGLWRFMGEWKRYAPVYEASELSTEVSRGGAYARYDLDELLEDVAATCGATQASLTRSSDAWSSILIHFLLVAFAQTFVVLNHVTLHTVGELKHTPYGYCYYFQDAFFVGSAGLVIFSTVVFAASVTSKCREVGMSCFGHPADQQKVAMILFAYTMLVLNSVIAILARRYNVGSPRRALAP